MVQVFFQCETPFHSYRRCAVHPDDHALLIGRHLLVDVDALLQEDQHGRRSHEGEHRVQDEAKHVQLWKWQQKKMRRVIILEWSTQRQTKRGRLAFNSFILSESFAPPCFKFDAAHGDEKLRW